MSCLSVSRICILERRAFSTIAISGILKNLQFALSAIPIGTYYSQKGVYRLIFLIFIRLYKLFYINSRERSVVFEIDIKTQIFNS